MKQLCLAVITIACFISCSKSDSATATPPTPPTAADTTTLLKMVVIDSTQTAPFDTTQMYKFDYDNMKRIAKVSIQAYDPASHLLKTPVTLTYTYTGTDTLPSHYYEYNRPINNAITLDWNHDFSYDAQGRMTKDSSNEVSNLYINRNTDKYIYTATGFTDSAFYYLPSPAVSANKVVVTKDANNNIIKQLPENSVTATEVVYDNHVNPLYKTSVGYPYLMNTTYLCFFLNTNITVQKNNFTKISTNTYDAAGTTILSSFSTNFNIIYKANGQPSVVRVSTSKYKYLYFYGN